MIAFVKGSLADVESDRVIIDVGGIGYSVFVSSYTMGRLPLEGNEVKLYTYLNVKEDLMQLYGFLSKDELRIFKLLIGVNGIGPKGGLGILSYLTPDDLRFAVMANDVKAISAAPGIGKKTAEKLILELKDKLGSIEPEEVPVSESVTGNTPFSKQIQTDAVQALVALGYGSTEALRAVTNVMTEQEDSVEEILKKALKFLI